MIRVEVCVKTRNRTQFLRPVSSLHKLLSKSNISVRIVHGEKEFQAEPEALTLQGNEEDGCLMLFKIINSSAEFQFQTSFCNEEFIQGIIKSQRFAAVR